MKIGINARFLTKPFTGIGQYTLNLIEALAKLDKKNEYILVVPEKVRVIFPKNVRIVILQERKVGTAGMKKTWWEQISVPEFFVKEKVDVAFFPYPSNPWSNVLKGIKTFVTIHDCIPWMEKKYRKGMMSKMYHAQTRKAVKRADVVLTVSEASAKDIVKVCDVKKRQIKVISNAASDIYKKKAASTILKKYKLKKGEYFLYVGGYDERKNVKYLLDEMDFDIPLVLAGGKVQKSKLYNSFDVKSVRKNVIRTGFLKDTDLAALYQNCLAFVNFSCFEGFNIPIIEAAYAGAPLVLSDIPVHREVCGNAAMFVDISTHGTGRAVCKKIIRSRNSYSKKSSSLAKRYSWKLSAQKFKDMLSS